MCKMRYPRKGCVGNDSDRTCINSIPVSSGVLKGGTSAGPVTSVVVGLARRFQVHKVKTRHHNMLFTWHVQKISKYLYPTDDLRLVELFDVAYYRDLNVWVKGHSR